MTSMSQRAVLRAPVGFMAASALACPHIANAQATTAILWIGQGFVPTEAVAFRKTAADYEKVSGNKLDYNILPFQALNQKVSAALTSGDLAVARPSVIFILVSITLRGRCGAVLLQPGSAQAALPVGGDLVERGLRRLLSQQHGRDAGAQL
jgi:hypothetical protein